MAESVLVLEGDQGVDEELGVVIKATAIITVATAVFILNIVKHPCS